MKCSKHRCRYVLSLIILIHLHAFSQNPEPHFNDQQVGKVFIQKTDSGLQVLINKKPVLFYRTTTAYPPEPLPDYYKRSGFIHPLMSPGGEVLTDDFPAGHAHQHGIFNTWVNTTYKGKPLDFWNQQNGTGTAEHLRTLEISNGKEHSLFKVLLGHRSLAEGIVIEELLTVKVYPYSKYYLFDFESEQVNITRDTLFLNKYHYGGLAFRGSKLWNPDDSLNFKSEWNVLTSAGLTNDSANHSRAEWVTISGVINEKLVSATVFDHPKNFRYPQHIRVHPAMPYWCFAPIVENGFFLAPREKYKARYRYLVEDGAGDPGLRARVRREWITDK